YRYQAAAMKRRELVLSNMLEYHLINEQQYEEANNEPIKLAPEKKLQEMADFHAPYFVRHILTVELKKLFGQDTNEMTYHYGINIFTTLDPRMQKVAEETVINEVERNKFRHIDDGALISIDPQTGAIKAMVGGTNYRKDQYNIVTQGHRQPGSSFKPFVYTTALLRGYTPHTIVYDRPASYPSGAGGVWTPKNSDGSYRGALELQQALWLSRNAAAVGVAADIKIQNIIDVAYRMGIKYPLEPYLPSAIGSSVVVPLEICSAYGTLANHGVHNEPFCISRVTTGDGQVLYEHRLRPKRAIPIEIADTMKTMMRGVIERGTGRAARCPFPASGKTGTTNSYRDAWFIGYTDDLVTAVWVGNRQNQSMNRTFGGTVPAPIWREFMLVAQPIMSSEHEKVHNYLSNVNNLPNKVDLDLKPSEYIVRHGRDTMRKPREHRKDRYSDASPPDKPGDVANTPSPPNPRDRTVVILCQQTHLRATTACPSTVAVTYVRGKPPYPPTQTCNVHTRQSIARNPGGNTQRNQQRIARGDALVSNRGITLSICSETGKLATSNCPNVLRRSFTPDNAPSETCPLHRE
ncbi:MAG TPA: penicillin-binding transpeptidase domain-containing protein, partial [Armatimonadota bacterium]|nr:penicillin-binding transpeptidase domain-containing protein [Armatimonadota bacterium]